MDTVLLKGFPLLARDTGGGVPGHGLVTRAASTVLDGNNRFDLSLMNNLELSRTEFLDRRPAVCNYYNMQLTVRRVLG